MKDVRYAYASAYTRTLENKMLERTDFEIILSASGEQEVVQYLVNRGYGGRAGEQLIDAEKLLNAEWNHAWNEVRDACPIGAPIHFFPRQNDFHNLKTILKAVFSDGPYETLMLEPYTVAPEIMFHAIAEANDEDLPKALKEPASEAMQILTRDGDGQHAELVVDRALFRDMHDMALQSNNEFLVGWVDLCIAIANIKTALRGAFAGRNAAFLRLAMPDSHAVDNDVLANAVAQGLPSVLRAIEQNGYPKAAQAARESVSEFEKWCDNELLRYIRNARFKTFGFEPIFGFLMAKQFELMNVRILLAGLRHGTPAEVLRERMRDSYV